MALCKFWIIPEDLLDPSVRKHQAGQHDQSTHGSWAGTAQINKPDSISFNGDTIKKGRDSMWEHLVPDGKGGYELTPERTKIYEDIVDKHLEGITPTGNPTFTLMGGGGGSGKGTVQKSPIAMNQADQYGVNIPTNNVVMVDPDEIKSMLPEFKYMVSKGRKEDAAGYTHEESSAISKIIQREAFGLGLDVLLDGTGNSKATALQKKIDQARNAGYTVNGAYVSASVENAWQRNMGRAIDSKTRGLVPAWAFLEAHKSVSDIIPYMAPQFDNWVLFDTNGAKGSTPPIIAIGHRGVPIQQIDRTAYKRFTDKAFTKVTPSELDAMWNEFKVGKI
jgi:predicted ABC-type ATPase